MISKISLVLIVTIFFTGTNAENCILTYNFFGDVGLQLNSNDTLAQLATMLNVPMSATSWGFQNVLFEYYKQQGLPQINQVVYGGCSSQCWLEGCSGL